VSTIVMFPTAILTGLVLAQSGASGSDPSGRPTNGTDAVPASNPVRTELLIDGRD